jgi:hypothetical protein
MSKTEKETKKNLDELKDRKIGEEVLENVAGGDFSDVKCN